MEKLKKIMYLLIALISFIVGVVGIFLPILPSTPLFLLTSFCLLKSSDKLNEKFMQTKIYKKYVKTFIEKGGMALKQKLCIIIPVSLLLLILFIITKNIIIRFIIIITWLAKIFVFIKIKTNEVDDK